MRNLILAAAWLLASAAAAAAFDCPAHFAGGAAPVVTRPALARSVRELCFAGHATLHSGLSRGPLYSAEHLIGTELVRGHADRLNAFHPDPRLPASERSELRDYQGSGYDRGHMAPAADMVTPEAEHGSFSLANMVPQVHANNAGLWSKIEERTRQRAIAAGELYVVTGPIFEGETLPSIGGGRVLVPSHLFKATYDPRTGETWAIVARNTAEEHVELVSVDALEARTGLTLFPGRPDS
jgi:endonuclease G